MPFLRLLALTAFLLLPLPQGHAATITANEPGWALQVLSWDLDKALPGVEYNYRVAVRGGVYPYTFALLDGPAGMTIHPRTGEIRWTPAAEAPAQAVRVSITDTRNASLTHNFSVAAERSAFRFVAATGNNLNTGTEASPWASLAYASAHAGTSSYIYVKAGTYRESMSINSSSCGRFLAYPGDAVTVIGTGSGSGSIWINGGNRLLFQGFTFDANDHRWLFSCDAGLLENVIWRKNTMHNAASDDWENPSFIFFWDGAQKPIQGQVHYRNIVMQENTFFDLANPNDHGASVTLYDVQDLLYEDNLAYAIDGRGVSDKDDGFRNTFRNNVVRDCAVGIGLYNQYSQGSIEIDHNLIYNCGTAVVLGGQPGYLRDVFVHHNTIAGSISLSWVLEEPGSTNINVYRNLITAGAHKPYAISPKRVDEPGGSYHYEYPGWFQTAGTKVNLDGNLVWTTGSAVAGYDWGIPATAWSGWQAQGFDANGLFANPGLDATYTLAPASPYFGSYGRDLASLSTDNYATWRAANFTGTDVAIDAVSGPLADPDGAGMSNYARYAFDLPARGPVAAPVTLDTAGDGTSRVLRLRFLRRAAATDLSYIVESSTNLVTWTPVPGHTYGPGTGPVTAEDTVALEAAPRRFLRLRITQP